MPEKQHETIQQILFWPAVDDYLHMDPEVRTKLNDLIRFDTDVGKDSHAELINISHAFVEIAPDLTVKAVTAVLLKVVEYAARIKAKGHRLHVGCVCVTRRPEELNTPQGKVKAERENIFVPVKVV